MKLPETYFYMHTICIGLAGLVVGSPASPRVQSGRTSAPAALSSDYSVLPNGIISIRRRSGSGVGAGSSPRRSTIGGTESLTSVAYNGAYVGTVMWGGQSLELLIDTGSSTTWAVKNDFACYGSNLKITSVDECDFGPGVNGTFRYGEVPDRHFNITYGSGANLNGRMGYEDITVGGITMAHQEVALVTDAYNWQGDGVTGGILGLGYPSLTKSYAGSDPSQDVASEVIHYNDVFTSMYQQNLTEPMFSLALTRNSTDGYLVFGGLPPVDHDAVFASTPITKANPFNFSRNPQYYSDYHYYTIFADEYIWSSNNQSSSKTNNEAATAPSQNISVSNAQFPIFVDSGTTLTYLPSDIAQSVLNAYSVTPTLSPNFGAWTVPCDATPPVFGVRIGGRTLYMDAKDMVVAEITDPDTGHCLCGVSDQGDSGPYVLGNLWLQSVVAVFDVGGGEMRFAQRAAY